MTTFHPIYNSPSDGALLRSGGTPFAIDFQAVVRSDRKYRLFFAGESAISKFWKNEPDFQWQYHTVTDALDTAHACKSQYCLDFSSPEPVGYTRRVYRKVAWPPALSYLWSPPTDDLTIGIRMRSDNLSVGQGGFLRMLLEVRLRKEGVVDGSIARPPDLVFTIDLTENTAGEWKDFSLPCKVPADDVVHLSVIIEGRGYRGEVFFERPKLETGLGWNLLPDFSVPVPDKQKFDWTAQYLSKKEWPRFSVELDGHSVFEGEIFERCHLNSEWEIPLPSDAFDSDSQHRLSVRLISQYHDPLPYVIHEIGLISEPRAKAVLVAASSIATAGGFARLLFETEQDNVEIEIIPHDKRLTGGNFIFAKAGLHGVRLHVAALSMPEAIPAGGRVALCRDRRGLCETQSRAYAAPAQIAPDWPVPPGFTIRCDGIETEAQIGRIVLRGEDGVVTGTGDMVYVHQDADSFREYLKWYIENEVGDLVTARPTYRWSGSRTLDAASWKDFARVLNELGMEYVHMWDGRELPGQNANPDADLLEGPGFRGHQTHERDGACFYWGVRPSNYSKFLRQLWEMQQRVWDEDPKHVNPQYRHENYFLVDGEMYWHRHPHTPRDMRLAHDMQIAHLAEIRENSPRHTGPTVMFKYFFEAGYSWVGYESMYGVIELYMAFLRGAAQYGGVARPGVHHAMQWSSSPYDVPEHVRRYRLALYSAYIQGACEINTEEGLWHIEEYYSGYNRFGNVCQEHLRQQQDFFRYTRSHTRRGTFRTPLALIHGRYDGWHGFGNHMPWGMANTPLTGAEKSWDLLKIFYPLSTPGKPSYCHYCPTDREIGFYSGTPLGCIDAIPVEASADQIGKYGALAFMGYNCADKNDLDKILAAVRGGCRLLLTRAHLTETTSYDEIAAGNLSQISHPLAFMRAAGGPLAPRRAAYGEGKTESTGAIGGPLAPRRAVYGEGREGTPLPSAAQNACNLPCATYDPSLLMRQSSYHGLPVTVCENALPPDEIIAVTDDGQPLVCRYKCGNGEVTLFNTTAWPSDLAIRDLYETELRRLMKEETAKESVWCECGDDVEFAVYSRDDGSSDVYFLAVDWYRDPAPVRHAVLRVGNCRYEVAFPFGTLVKAVVRDTTAAWSLSENVEIIDVTGTSATVQGYGKCDIFIAANGSVTEREIDFAATPVQTVAL